MAMSANFHIYHNDRSGPLDTPQEAVIAESASGLDPYISFSIDDGNGNRLNMFMHRTDAAQMANFLDAVVAEYDAQVGIEIMS